MLLLRLALALLLQALLLLQPLALLLFQPDARLFLQDGVQTWRDLPIDDSQAEDHGIVAHPDRNRQVAEPARRLDPLPPIGNDEVCDGDENAGAKDDQDCRERA